MICEAGQGLCEDASVADNAPTRPLALDLANTEPLGKPGDPGVVASRLGRYVVLDVLGRGGMGIVYAAYDPVLDRKIALKLLLALEGDDATAGRARMHREAQPPAPATPRGSQPSRRG